MNKETSDLLDELHANITKDRQRLEKACDILINKAENEIDPEKKEYAQMQLAKGLPFLADSLTKVNAHLVELTKMKMKSSGAGDEDPESEKDDLYDAIEGDKQPLGN